MHVALAHPFMMPLSRAITDPGARGGAAEFDPASLFGVNDRGVVYDATDADNLFQSSAGSGAVSLNDPIGYIADLGPTGKPALQATAASRPIYSGVPRTYDSNTAAALSTWTAGVGWSEAGGVATAVAGSASTLSVAATLTAGKVYAIFFTTTRTAGAVVARLTGGTTVTGVSRNVAGSFVDYLPAVTGNTTIEFSKDATFAGTVTKVEIREVLTFTNMGACFDSADDFMQSASVDMSNSDKQTMVVCFKSGQIATAQTVLAHGNYNASLTGSTEIAIVSGLVARLRGDTGAATITAPSVETPIIFNPQENVLTGLFDIAGASIATELDLRVRGSLVTETTAGTTAGGGNLANLGVTLGRGFSASLRLQGIIRRAFVINRTLTSDEILEVETWARQGTCYGALLGDSTTAFLNSSALLPVAMRVTSLIGGFVCNAADIADAGDRIADQKALWTSLANKTALQAVFVSIGANDIKGRIGNSGVSLATVIADYQDLIDTINASKPVGCKVYLCAITPCKGWLDAATNPSAANAGRTGLNEAIMGLGSTPITGVDGRIDGFLAGMDDGSGNLKAEYDYNADGVHPSTTARALHYAPALRAALEADGLVS